MKKLLGTLLMLSMLAACTGGGGGSDSDEADSKTSKSLWSKWEMDVLQWNFTGGQFYTNMTTYVYLPITQTWINVLNNAGRDTTGLVAGTYYTCELTIYFIGTEESGQFSTNHVDIDEPAHNACLEWDSNCSIGVCNFANDHKFTKSGNTLVIDYFGTSDNGRYGVDYME